MKNKSFTLIELLVVIAIIGLLSSIVLVSLDLPGKKQKARITKSLSFSQSLQNVLGSEAVGIWSFDDQTNPTADTSGNGNNGTINGASFTPDTPQSIIGQGSGKYALSFDGVDDYVKTPINNFVGWTRLTYEAWVKPTVNTACRRVIDKGGGRSTIDINCGTGGKLEFGIGTGGPFTILTSDAPPVDVWTHIVGTYDSSNMRLYVNGKLKAATPKTGAIEDVADKLAIGANNGGTFFFWNGLIDEVRVYSRALTAGEIKKHYVEGLEKHNNLTQK